MANKSENNNGFIVIYRSILDWEHITEPRLVQVFLYLLCRANHNRKKYGKFWCGRGETLVSIRTICTDLNMSAHTALEAIKRLEESGEITRVFLDKQTTKTTINNFCKYQPRKEQKGVAKTATLNGEGVAENATLTATLTATKQQCKEYNTTNTQSYAHTHTHEESEIVGEIMSHRIALDGFCASNGISPDQFRQLANEVVNEWQLMGKTHTSQEDERKHIMAVVKLKIQTLRENGLLFDDEMAERKAKFIAECKALITQGHNREQVIEFARYYSQPTLDGKRMIFETFKGWDTTTRFILNQRKQKAL